MEQQDHDDLLEYLEEQDKLSSDDSYNLLIEQFNEDIPF